MNLLNLGKAAAVLGLVATPSSSSAKRDTVINNESKEGVVGEEAAGKDQVITLQQLVGGGIFFPIPLLRLIEDLIQPFSLTVNICPTLSPNVGILLLQDTPRSSRKGLQSCVNLGDEGGFGAGSPLKGSFPRRPAKELAQVR